MLPRVPLSYLVKLEQLHTVDKRSCIAESRTQEIVLDGQAGMVTVSETIQLLEFHIAHKSSFGRH